MLFEYLFNSNRDRGVSPVIGVIFMVAAVVIIAASIGVTVLDTADGVSDPTPQVKFDVEETDSGMKITHTNRDSIDGDQIRLAGAATTETISEWEGETVSAGDSAIVETTQGEMEIIWEGGNEDSSSQLASLDVSDTATVGRICRIYLNGLRVGADDVEVDIGTVKNTPDDNVYVSIEHESDGEIRSTTSTGDETLSFASTSAYFDGDTFTVRTFTEDGGEVLEEKTISLDNSAGGDDTTGVNERAYC